MLYGSIRTFHEGIRTLQDSWMLWCSARTLRDGVRMLQGTGMLYGSVRMLHDGVWTLQRSWCCGVASGRFKTFSYFTAAGCFLDAAGRLRTLPNAFYYDPQTMMLF